MNAAVQRTCLPLWSPNPVGISPRRHPTVAPPSSLAWVGHVIEQYPFARKNHLVMDNLNIHCRQSLIGYFGEQEGGYLWDRLTVHYTPKHGSWLNQAEIELSLYSRPCLGRRRIPNLAKLKQETKTWNGTANGKRTTINWRFTRKKARKLFKYKKPDSTG